MYIYLNTYLHISMYIYFFLPSSAFLNMLSFIKLDALRFPLPEH